MSDQSDTIFGKIIRGEAPAEKVFEDDDLIAIRDINPLSRVHLLVIPKEIIRDISQAEEKHQALLGKMLLVGAELARKEGISETGFRLALNCGDDAGLLVPHLHLHVIGGAPLGAPA